MAQNPGAALLVAVNRAVQRELAKLQDPPMSGGKLVWWPTVAAVMHYLKVDCGDRNTVRKRYDRWTIGLSPEAIDAMDASVDPETYREAIRHVLEHGEAPAGANPPTGQIKVEPQAADESDVPDSERPATVEYPDLKLPAEPGWGFEFLRKITAVQRSMQALDTTQTKARAVIGTDLPVGVVFPGDFHLGGRGTDHELMVADFEMWRALFPAVRLVGMGDYSEQFTGALARVGLHQHLTTPDMQIETVMDVFTGPVLSDLWLAFLKGNHDGWAGPELANYVMRMARKCGEHGVPFLGLGGELHLTVGRVEYKLALWHRYPGASALNKGNNQRRVRIDHNGADVVALAHLHNAYVEYSQTGDINHVALRCGAYKTTDEHSRDAAGNVVADSRMPMVIFSPSERDMLYYEDFKKGVPELLRLRREWSRHQSFRVDSTRLRELMAQ